MKRTTRRRFLITVIILLLLISAGFSVLYMAAANPPVDTIHRCELMLSKARNAEAKEYAGDLLKAAENSWQETMLEWKIQNTGWFFDRDYTRLTVLAQATIKKAQAAYEKSISVKDSLHHDLAFLMNKTDQKIIQYEKTYHPLPLNRQARVDYNTAKMLFLESREAYERGNYNSVGPKLEKSNALIGSAVKNAHSTLQDYFSNTSKWKNWVHETIEWSKQNQAVAIVVDKFARRCYVYKDGRIIHTFHAEFGPNWIGIKKHKGDKATPEGKYHVTKKKSKRDTRYYKALLINYPNDEDKARFSREITKGNISKRTGIGGLIEIHGGGGKGINWTDGCVALTNEDMDKIFDIAVAGTPVTIVGSMKSLKEVNGL